MKLLVFIILVLGLSCTRTSQTEPDQDVLNPDVRIMVSDDQVQGQVSDKLIGFNMNFEDDNDRLWAKGGKLPSYLQEMGTGVLRYPGGGKTSHYHWHESHYPRYCDAWNPVAREKVDSSRISSDHMDIDEFFDVCKRLGAEPLLGINIMSGEKLGLRQKSIEDQSEMLRHCKDKGYPLTYLYLDNEVDTPKAYWQMDVETYARLIKIYVSELRKIDPDFKFIANFGGNSNLMGEKWTRLAELAGDFIDVIDVHIYYDWDTISWNNWLSQLPMVTCAGQKTIQQNVQQYKDYLASIGKGHIEVASLEWNLAPIKDGRTSFYQQTIMQSEMLGQILSSRLDMACLWPLIYIGKKGSLERPSPVQRDQPEKTTATYEMMKMYSSVSGADQLKSWSSDRRMVSYCFKKDAHVYVYLINKSAEKRTVLCNLDGKGHYKTGYATVLSSKNLYADDMYSVSEMKLSVKDNAAAIEVQPYSFTRLDFIGSEI